MDNKKVLERSVMRVRTDKESSPDQDSLTQFTNEIEKQYNLKDKTNITLQSSNSMLHSTIEIKIDSYEKGLPIEAAVEMFVMKLGNIMIYERYMKYEVIR